MPSSLAGNQLQRCSSTFFYFMPNLLLSGFMFPFRGMPGVGGRRSAACPLTHHNRLVRGILLKGNDWPDLWPSLWPLMVFALVVMTVAVRFYRWNARLKLERRLRHRAGAGTLLAGCGRARLPGARTASGGALHRRAPAPAPAYLPWSRRRRSTPTGGACSARPSSTRWCAPRSPAARPSIRRVAKLTGSGTALPRAAAAANDHWSTRFGAERQRIDPATFGFPQAPNPGVFNVFSLGATCPTTSTSSAARSATERSAPRSTCSASSSRRRGSCSRQRRRRGDPRRGASGADRRPSRRCSARSTPALAIGERASQTGGVSALELRQRAQLAGAETAAAAACAACAGGAPAERCWSAVRPAGALPAPRVADLTVPPSVPLRPAIGTHVRQRPDIPRQRALLHKAERDGRPRHRRPVPEVHRQGLVLVGAARATDLFGNGINVWNLGFNLLQPLLHGGETQTRQRARRRLPSRPPRRTGCPMLQDLQNVADALRALRGRRAGLRVPHRAVGARRRAWRITRKRFDAGGVSQFALLDAERQRSQRGSTGCRRRNNRCADVALLLQGARRRRVADNNAPR